MHYAVGRSALEDAGKSCRTCADPRLALDGGAAYDVVLITPGFATGSRPRRAPSDYWDDPENRDGDDRFVSPRSAKAERDAIYAITGATVGCAANARVLLDNAPCIEPGGIRAVCQSAVANVSGCTCESAARAVVRPPCAASLQRAECATAVTQLRRCTS
jgi:hypothetical protein